MISCNKIYTIKEYEAFTREQHIEGYTALPKKVFDTLEKFILTNVKIDEKNTGLIELLAISVRKNIGKIITARNYVGVISLCDGTTIEILPKITNKDLPIDTVRKIFLTMLKHLKNIEFKKFDVSKLQTDKCTIFEIFIKMFLDEVRTFVQNGLKSTYTNIESNECYYKGKFIIPQHIRYNSIRKDRFFVCYNEFNINIPENRLIKMTLKMLLKITQNINNYSSAQYLLHYFHDADDSLNIDTDFSKCNIDRTMKKYKKILDWCRIFLRHQSFTAFSGENIAFALLFPMEKIFEVFIAYKVQKKFKNSKSVKIQDCCHHLYDKPYKAFSLRPDIVLRDVNRHNPILIDTKWKILSPSSKNFGISQHDMYQMYVYGKKYNAKKIFLIYPKYQDAINEDIIYESCDNIDNIKVRIYLFDLLNMDSCLDNLLEEINSN